MVGSMTTRRSLLIVALAALLPALSCATVDRAVTDVYVGWTTLMNGTLRAVLGEPPGPREPPAGVEMVFARGSYVYIVTTADGVVLVDSGFDTAAEDVRAAVGDRPILAVLLTHVHRDHADGAAGLDVPVYIGEADAAVWRGDRHLRAIFSHASQHVTGPSPLPADLRGVHDGQRLVFGGETFRALACPGHTPGSTCWRFRDVAFTGDAMTNMTGRSLEPAPFTVTDDEDLAYESMRRLLLEDISVILDAHYGRTNDPRRVLSEAIARHRESS
jgi:glyoxylase-like metal-dependent hydrolase (beta-lactamase superfamily II)